MASKAPPPSSPAGVPSGNGKYIALALLLLLVIGGIAYWKLSQKPPEPVTVIPVDAAAPPPTRTVDDDIPPPPPEDAGVEAGKKVVVVYAGNGCAAKCTGKVSSDLQTSLSFRARQAHRCYDNALAQDPTLKGRISISVRVGTDGSVCSAGIASNDMGTPMVANCVLGYFKNGGFPPAQGGCADVAVPINFKPR